MKKLKQEVKQIFIFHFCEKNFVLYIKRMIVLIAVMFVFESASEYFNFSDLIKSIIIVIMFICFMKFIYDYLIYRLKETKEAIKEIIMMIKNL